MNQPSTPLRTVTSTDIATMAGVGPSAVSNWRKRDPDFPEPVAGSVSSPRFDVDAVRAWLRAKGRSVGDLPVGQGLRAAIEALRSALRPEEAVALASQLITLRHLTDPDALGYLGPALSRSWSDLVGAEPAKTRARFLDLVQDVAEAKAELGEVLAAPPLDDAALRHLVDAVNSVEASRMPELFDDLHDTAKRAERGRSEFRTPTPLIELLTQVARTIPGPVFDPTCGTAELLLEVARDGAQRDRVVGAEIYRDVWRTAVQRMAVHGVPAELHLTDVLSADLDRIGAGLIVADPPFGLRRSPDQIEQLAQWRISPAPSRLADLAWLQLAVWHLNEDGRGVVLLPAGATFRGGHDARVRAELLRQGCIEAVVSLPTRITGVGTPPTLWIVTSTESKAPRNEVLLVDAMSSDLGPAAIAELLADWRTKGSTPNAAPARAVSTVDILARDADLLPHRWITPETVLRPPQLSDIADALDRVKQRIDGLLKMTLPDAEDYRTSNSRPSVATVRDLTGTRLEVFRGRGRPSEAGEEAPLITRAHVRAAHDGHPASPATTKSMETFRTQPGDVLVTLDDTRLAAMVDHRGGHAVGSFVDVVRPLGTWARPEYLALALTAPRNDRFRGTALTHRIDVRDFEIPMLPLADQDAMIKAADALRTCATRARDLTDHAERALHTLLASVTGGAVAPQTRNHDTTGADA